VYCGLEKAGDNRSSGVGFVAVLRVAWVIRRTCNPMGVIFTQPPKMDGNGSGTSTPEALSLAKQRPEESPPALR